MALATVQTDLVEVGRRLREISPAHVEALASSIAEIGLLNPITVFPRKVIQAGISVDGYGLVAGAHRLEACRRLGLVDIDASVVELSELERQIAECDENLCGSVLSKAERVLFTNRRKEAYEAMHGPAKAIGGRASAASQGKNVTNAETASVSFTADTAAKTGQSLRTVQVDVERGAKISERALSMLKGTNLDTGTYLDKLKTIDPGSQVKAVRDDLDAARKPKPVKLADVPLNDFEAKEKQVAALMSAWNKASAEAREEFMTRIDTPIMDRRFG